MKRTVERFFVLGLDGVPHSLVRELASKGFLPNLADLIRRGRFLKLRSVLPTVSSVAWACYMTGVNPGKHNIFGYADRCPDPFELFIPTAAQLQRETLWEVLSRAGKRVVVINVPLTYPPTRVNGVMIGGFLTPSLEKGVYPASLVPALQTGGYRIDVEVWRAREDLEGLLRDLHTTLERRFNVAFDLMSKEPWDFFQLHIMGTDRINHFLWPAWEEKHPVWAGRFIEYYRRIDHYVGELFARLGRGLEGGGTRLLLLSDHGFCRVDKVLQVNHWLEQEGYLNLPQGDARRLSQYLPQTRAYSMIPGRIFVNLEGREAKGSVPAGAAYEALRDELIEGLSALKDPGTHRPMVHKVHRREEVYEGAFLGRAADLIIEPHNGYDLKADLDEGTLTAVGGIGGMHTLDDAFVLLYPGGLSEGDLEMTDMMPGILAALGVPIPQGLDGRAF